MNDKHRATLRRQWTRLRRDMEPKKLLPYLVAVLDETDEQEVKSKETREERCDKLLEIIPRKGAQAFGCFLEALESVQPFLADSLKEEADRRVAMNDKHRATLRRQWTRLRRDMEPKQLLPYLVAVLDETDEQEVKSKETREERCDKLLEIIPRRGAQAFGCFLEALESVQPFLADSLKEEAEREQQCSIDDIPPSIPWTSESQRFKSLLDETSKRLHSTQVGKYFYHNSPIGSGRFGTVHAGINCKDTREVAIKRTLQGLLVRKEDTREIENLSKLGDCSQVVRYLDFTVEGGVGYIVLELMEGDLEAYLNGNPDPCHNVKLCKDLVLGVQFLHRKGILHRDLKPGNILYKPEPLCLKIADFGLSSNNRSLMSMSVMHSNAGTRCWMAPELMNQESPEHTELKHTERSDMFACGLVIHFILSPKENPFAPSDCAGKSKMIVEAETQINITNFKSSISVKLSYEASDLVTRMISECKDDRISATDALAHPFFWSNNKKVQVLQAVGDQPEIEAPRGKRPLAARSPVEIDLETSFTKHFHGDWNVPKSVPVICNIYHVMTSGGPRKYDTKSCVELLRFIRNSYAHSSHSRGALRPPWFEDALFKDNVFFIEFPWLVIEVYNIIVGAGWDKSRPKVKASIESSD